MQGEPGVSCGRSSVRRARFGGLIVAVAVACASACAGSSAGRGGPGDAEAAAVVERHLEAQGGRAALESLKVVERTGALEVFLGAGGGAGVYRTCVVYPGAAVVSVDAGVVQVAEMIREDGAWMCSVDFGDCQVAHAQKADALATFAREDNRELIFEVDRWVSASVSRDPGGIEIRASTGTGGATYRFEAEGGLLVERREGDRSRRYLDWRPVEGIAFPHVIEEYDGETLMTRLRLFEIVVSEHPSEWCQGRLE